MHKSHVFLPLIAASVFLAACSSQQEPATNIVTQAETALDNLRADAARFAPEQLRTADATLAKMKQDLADEEYNDVVETVPRFNQEVRTLQETMVGQQSVFVAAQQEWERLSAEVPKIVEALQVRVDALQGALPKDITRQTFEAAKTELETMKATRAEATAAATAGDTLTATDKGRLVQAKGEELKDQLG